MVVKGAWSEKVSRSVRTVYFLVVMVTSLLVVALPVAVALGDAILPCLLIPSFTCVKCCTFREHLQRYAFKSSLMDIPLVSITRSLIIICVYSMCDGPALSHGPYLGTVTLCSFTSILLLSVKACVFTVNSQLEAEASTPLSRKRLHLKKSWGMPVLFLSSVVFALGHIVVAYRTSCKARRKLIFHRGDPEAALSCMGFAGYPKVPRSPTPSSGKSFRIVSETKRKAPGLAYDDGGHLPVSLLADQDSLFISCHGLTVHYKLSMPGSPSRSLSSTNLFDRPCPSLSFPLKNQYHMHRSISNHFHRNASPLCTPLLHSSPTSPISEDVPILSLNETCEDDELCKPGSPRIEQDAEANEQFGIVLVHGFGGGVFSWRKVMGIFARQMGCSVVAFDRPGWGLTSRPRQKDWEENQLPNPYKLDNQVDLLLSFCLEMKFTSVVLIGHDDGGLLAMKAVEKLQSSANSISLEIKGVVLLNISLTRELVPSFARILLRTSLGKKHLVRPLLRTEITQVVNRRAWYDAAKLTTEVLSLYKAPLYVEGWDEALHEIGKLSYETVLSPQNAASMLKAVEKMPILVIAGAEDVLVPLKSVQTMASQLVNSRLVAISGCGHLPHEECPKALLAAISPFISRLLSIPEMRIHLVNNSGELFGRVIQENCSVARLIEVIELPIKHPELFESLGIAQPKGVLLYGPPGTGKTLLARAVAHHTDCTFIRVSGSELVQKYIGEGSRMVRELFVMAREHAPSIIFMDEIDSIGSARMESGSGNGDSEVQRTMLELLNQLDGFEASNKIKVLMATNRIDILDQALLRPGRIDRKIEFPNPNEDSRADILKIHSRRMNLMRGIDLKKIAEKMNGASGAELKAVCTEAGMFALRERRVHVTQEDFEMAVAKVMKKETEKNMSLRKLWK